MILLTQNPGRLRRLDAVCTADYTKSTACPVNAASQRFPVCACGIMILLTQNPGRLCRLDAAHAADDNATHKGDFHMAASNNISQPVQGSRRDIDRITIKKGKRGDFSPLQPDHYHNFFEIFYLMTGECRFLLKDSVYQLSKGDLVFIAPGEPHHSLYAPGDFCEIVNICFKKDHIPQPSAEEFRSFMGSVPVLYQEEFHNLLARMLSENSHIDEYSDSFMSCYLKELLLMLMRHSVMNEKEPELLNSKDADILLATKYIYKNFKKPLTLKEVSDVASLSPTYFSKKFKQITGMGFKEYLNFVRLKHAQAALLTTNNTITDIALEYGFNDSNYFKDMFKKVYGKSPREFRKNPN